MTDTNTPQTDKVREPRNWMPSGAEWLDMAATLCMMAIALFAFRSSYGGVWFLAAGMIAAVVAVALLHLGRVFRWPLLITSILAVAVYALLASVLALRHYGLGRVAPSPRSIVESFTSAVTGWKELITTAPPVGTTGDLMVIPVVSGFVAAFATYLLARRMKVATLALIPPMIVLGLAIAVGTNAPVSLIVHGAVFIAAAVAWMALREHQRRPLLEGHKGTRSQIAAAAAVLGVAGAAGFFGAPYLPGSTDTARAIWRQTVTPPFDPRQYPSPLNAYRKYVKLDRDENGEQIPAEVMFTIEGLPQHVPVRLATMDTYDGLVWQVSAGDPDEPSLNDSGSFERIGARLEPEFDGEYANVTVTIGKYNDIWIPDVGEVVTMKFIGSTGGPERDRALADSFRYNRATDTGATVLRLTEGDRYEMRVRLPLVLENMAGVQINPQASRIGQARSVPEVVQQLASPDLLTISSTAERLDRVKTLMIRDGAYSDGDIDGGHIRAKAGHSASRLAEFVDQYPRRPFVGNAEQYASAYALLFRDLDRLPTRVVMGFLPIVESLHSPVEVLATDVEAWVEVPVQGKGWVGIFPTPPRDQLSSSSTSPQQPEPDYRTQNPPPPPLVDPEFDQPAKAEGDAKALEEDEAATDDTKAADGPSALSTLSEFVNSRAGLYTGIAVSPVVLFVGFAIVVGLAKLLRRRRRKSKGAEHERIANGWREVTDYATDRGQVVPDTVTRREAASFVGAGTIALANKTDAAVWGGQTLTDAEVQQYWEELSATLKEIKSELSFFDRIKAALSTRSLKLRRRKVELERQKPRRKLLRGKKD